MTWAACALAVVRIAWLFVHSDGVWLDDEIGHYIIARDAWHDPRFLLNLWGRGVNTLLYATVAPFGFDACRMLSVALIVATAFATFDLARRLGFERAGLAAILLLFQPWVLELGQTCLTEVPFMLFMVAGTSLALAGRRVAPWLILGALPLIRHEGVVIVGLWMLRLVAQRRWREAMLIAFPFVAFNVASGLVLNKDLFRMYFEPKPTDEYGSGGWFHFVPRVMLAANVVLVPAALGLVEFARSRERAFVAATYGVYAFTHVVLFRFGLFASGGYVEFMLPLAPIFAVAALAGIDSVIDARSPGRAARVAVATATVLGVMAMGLWFSQSRPSTRIERACKEAAAWLRAEGLARRPMVATHVALYAAVPFAVPHPAKLWGMPLRADEMEPTTIVLWDRKYSESFGLAQSQFTAPGSGWRELAAFGADRDVVVYGH